MKTLEIPFLQHTSFHSDLKEVDVALDNVAVAHIAEVPWNEYPYQPQVTFKIAHTSDSIVLKFMVREKYIKAEYRNTNDPVYNDSCVEFFISFDGVNYYNLEFNCVGTGLIGYGMANKNERKRLPNDVIERVKTHNIINPSHLDGQDTEWHLLLNIPLNIFLFNTIDSLSGLHCTGNFYKCGDELPDPHFVSWNKIMYPTPNFHLPQFFGKLLFM